MKPQRCSTNYCIPVELEDFKKLLKWEDESHSSESRLYQLIDKVEGVDNCDYDGHFGSYIYYRVDVLSDTPGTHKKIINLIKETIDKAL
jgi:hypothetical protein